MDYMHPLFIIYCSILPKYAIIHNYKQIDNEFHLIISFGISSPAAAFGLSKHNIVLRPK